MIYIEETESADSGPVPEQAGAARWPNRGTDRQESNKDNKKIPTSCVQINPQPVDNVHNFVDSQ